MSTSILNCCAGRVCVRTWMLTRCFKSFLSTVSGRAGKLSRHSAISDSHPASVSPHEIEAWCNKVAAELLVPLAVLRREYRRNEDLSHAVARLGRRFKVSGLVILRRIHDAGELSAKQFREAYDDELLSFGNIKKSKGGDFVPTAWIPKNKNL